MYLQKIPQHLRHADLERLEAAAASCGNEGDVGVDGGKTVPERIAEVTAVDVHHQQRPVAGSGGHVRAPHLQRRGGTTPNTDRLKIRTDPEETTWFLWQRTVELKYKDKNSQSNERRTDGEING